MIVYSIALDRGLAKAWLRPTLQASVVETDTIEDNSEPKVRVLEGNTSDEVNPTIWIQFGSLYLTRLIFLLRVTSPDI